jgi:hypothetical protein
MARLRFLAAVVAAYVIAASGNSGFALQQDPAGRCLQASAQLRGGGLGGRALFSALRQSSNEHQSRSSSFEQNAHGQQSAPRSSVSRAHASDDTSASADGDAADSESSTGDVAVPDVTVEDVEKAFTELSPAALEEIVCSAAHKSRIAAKQLTPAQRAHLARGFKPWKDHLNEEKFAELRADLLQAMQEAQARADSDAKTATQQQSDDNSDSNTDATATATADNPAAAVAAAQRAALRRRLEAAAAHESQQKERKQERKQQRQQRSSSDSQPEVVKIQMSLLDNSDGRKQFLNDVLRHYVLLFSVKLPTLLLEASIGALGTGVRVNT